MNRSKDLRALFRQHLINERKRPTACYPPNYSGNPMYGRGCVGGVHKFLVNTSMRLILVGRYVYTSMSGLTLVKPLVVFINWMLLIIF